MTENAEVTRCPCEDCGQSCVSISSQLADVSLPVRLLPFARPGEVESECFGEPSVIMRQCCGGKSCELVITQTVRFSIPIEFGASAQAGEPAIQCKRPPCGGVCT